MAYETVTVDVNGGKKVIGYKLINALTGKPLSVTANNKVYEIFGTNTGALEFADETGSSTGVYYIGKDDAVGGTSDGWRYDLQAVPVENLTASELNKVKNGYFGLQFGFINAQGAYENYASVEGANPFAFTRKVLPHVPQSDSIAHDPRNTPHTKRTDGILANSESLIVRGLSSSTLDDSLTFFQRGREKIQISEIAN